MQIGEVLNRRSDLGTFVVHLTKGVDPAAAKENLISIIRDRQIEARTAYGWAQGSGAGGAPTLAGELQHAVCLSETPLEHIYSLFAPIEGRQVNLSPYGVGFTKMTARQKGALPVWYVDRTAGAAHQWAVAEALDTLRDHALQTPTYALSQAIAKVLPYCEVMGTWPGSQKEFWWEREWRKVGDLSFSVPEVPLWLAPEADHAELEQVLRAELDGLGWTDVSTPAFLDPSWGLERMIAKLAGLPPEAVTPFFPK